MKKYTCIYISQSYILQNTLICKYPIIDALIKLISISYIRS